MVMLDSQPVVIDSAGLSYFMNTICGGDTDCARDFVSDFIDDGTNLIESLRGALSSGDLAGANRHAHTLKSTAAMFAAPRLAEQAGQVESLTGAGLTPAAEVAVVRLEAEFQRVARILEGII